MNNKDTIFLAKVQILVNTLEEIEELCKNNPNEQQTIDYEISDYLHLLQDEILDDSKKIELMDKLKELRTTRVCLNNTFALIKAYNENKNGLMDKSLRKISIDNIKGQMKSLNKPYKYRILSDEDVNSFKHVEENNIKSTKRHYKRREITKEQLEERFNNGMRGVDIAKEFNCGSTYITYLKKKYGIVVRKEK